VLIAFVPLIFRLRNHLTQLDLTASTSKTTMSFLALSTKSSFTFQEFVSNFGFGPHKANDNMPKSIGRCDDTKKNATVTTFKPPEQKRSFAEITMKLTEAAEDIFLFGSGHYHERPAKRRRRDPAGDRCTENGDELPDFQLATVAVWKQAQASSSLLDTEC
jgi:hypothetical protein